MGQFVIACHFDEKFAQVASFSESQQFTGQVVNSQTENY